MAASRDELVEQHDALAGGISQRMAQAKAQAASDGLPFDAEKWATGRTSAAQFKYGAPYYVRTEARSAWGLGALLAPWQRRPSSSPHASAAALPSQPVVRGVPSLGQAVAGMNAFDYSRVLIWGGTSAAIGAVVGEQALGAPQRPDPGPLRQPWPMRTPVIACLRVFRRMEVQAVALRGGLDRRRVLRRRRRQRVRVPGHVGVDAPVRLNSTRRGTCRPCDSFPVWRSGSARPRAVPACFLPAGSPAGPPTATPCGQDMQGMSTMRRPRLSKCRAMAPGRRRRRSRLCPTPATCVFEVAEWHAIRSCFRTKSAQTRTRDAATGLADMLALHGTSSDEDTRSACLERPWRNHRFRKLGLRPHWLCIRALSRVRPPSP